MNKNKSTKIYKLSKENLMTLPDVHEEEKTEHKKEENKLQNNPSFASVQFDKKKKEQELSSAAGVSSFLKKNNEKPPGAQLNSNLTSNSCNIFHFSCIYFIELLISF